MEIATVLSEDFWGLPFMPRYPIHVCEKRSVLSPHGDDRPKGSSWSTLLFQK
jgi:hypothetical protein